VIFVTVGTHHQPFHRLLGAVASLAPLDEIVVQHGDAPAPPEADLAVAYLSPSEIEGYVDRARAVVMHAGVGSFVVAWRAGHVPVMVPRLRRHGEHVDDHQAQLVRALEREHKIVAVWDIDRLADAVQAAPPRRSRQLARPGPLHSAVRRAMDGEPFVAPASAQVSRGGLARPLGLVHVALERMAAPANRGRASAAAVVPARVNGTGPPYDAAWAASRWSPPDTRARPRAKLRQSDQSRARFRRARSEPPTGALV
jgi:beta-1,4-N-acetylglucosaminyltransferase